MAATADARRHWQEAYRRRQVTEVSWYQPRPEMSLELIAGLRLPPDAAIVDVGGGASTLVDHLLDAGYRNLTVLDLAATALDQARARLGGRGDAVCWLVADVTRWEPETRFDLWHDRAVFHFLTEPDARERYRHTLLRAVRPGGHALVATFASDGPERCSGLPVRRYGGAELQIELGAALDLVEERRELHRTPAGHDQPFTYALLRRRG
jgi:SAM-dependent methyltransferase